MQNSDDVYRGHVTHTLQLCSFSLYRMQLHGLNSRGRNLHIESTGHVILKDVLFTILNSYLQYFFNLLLYIQKCTLLFKNKKESFQFKIFIYILFRIFSESNQESWIQSPDLIVMNIHERRVSLHAYCLNELHTEQQIHAHCPTVLQWGGGA